MKTISCILPLSAWLLAPLMLGIINRIKAFFAGRQGQSVFQLYYDLAKLLKKGSVYSRTTSRVFRYVPSVVLSAMVLATLMIPWGGLPAPVSFAGDLILLAYLLGAARFAMVLAALDTGSSFEGMGASREVQFAALAEPSLFLGMVVLAIQTGHGGLSDIFASLTSASWQSAPALLFLVACSWMVLLLCENSRIPIDDPNTHLELTMIHEVMVLDYGGPDLGYMLYAAALKLWIFSALLVNLLVPSQLIGHWMQIPLFLVGMVIMATLVGVVESIMARLRLMQVPNLLIGAGALGAMVLILKLVG